MAVAPPYDIIIEKIPTAISQMERVFQKIQTKITEVALTVAQDSIKLPKRIKCTDPRVVRLKQLLNKLLFYIQELLKYLGWLSIVTTILYAIAVAGATYVAIRQTITLPLIAADAENINFQKELYATIKTIIQKFSPILALILASVATASVIIAPAIELISRICVNEEIPVSSFTAEALNNIQQMSAELESEFYREINVSEFYREINVSDEDIQSRKDSIDQLIEQQRSLFDLLEAPSTVILVSTIPDNTLGKAGDYAINKQQRIIYGPKPSDSEWNVGIKY